MPALELKSNDPLRIIFELVRYDANDGPLGPRARVLVIAGGAELLSGVYPNAWDAFDAAAGLARLWVSRAAANSEPQVHGADPEPGPSEQLTRDLAPMVRELLQLQLERARQLSAAPVMRRRFPLNPKRRPKAPRRKR